MNTNTGTTTPSPALEADPLATPAGEVKFEYPILPENVISNFEIVTVEKKTSDKGSERLDLVLRTTVDLTGSKGEAMNKGFFIRQSIFITPSEYATPVQIRDRLSKILLACGDRTSSARNLIDNPSILEGKVFQGKTKIRKDKNGEYPDQNEVSFIPPKKG